MMIAELGVVLLVALLAFGPKQLPQLMSNVAWLARKAQQLRQAWFEAWQGVLQASQLQENEKRAEKADKHYL